MRRRTTTSASMRHEAAARSSSAAGDARAQRVAPWESLNEASWSEPAHYDDDSLASWHSQASTVSTSSVASHSMSAGALSFCAGLHDSATHPGHHTNTPMWTFPGTAPSSTSLSTSSTLDQLPSLPSIGSLNTSVGPGAPATFALNTSVGPGTPATFESMMNHMNAILPPWRPEFQDDTATDTKRVAGGASVFDLHLQPHERPGTGTDRSRYPGGWRARSGAHVSSGARAVPYERPAHHQRHIRSEARVTDGAATRFPVAQAVDNDDDLTLGPGNPCAPLLAVEHGRDVRAAPGPRLRARGRGHAGGEASTRFGT